MGELHASLARVIIRIYTIKTMLCLMLASGLQQASTLSRQQGPEPGAAQCKLLEVHLCLHRRKLECTGVIVM